MRHSNPIKQTLKPEVIFRDFIVPEPLETLITMNAFYETLSDLDKSFSNVDKFSKAFVDSAMANFRTPPTNLPVSVRRKILRDVGFADAEIVDILTSQKCARFSDSSTHLLYTSPDFVSTMKSRLQILRTKGSSLQLNEPHQYWAVMTNW